MARNQDGMRDSTGQAIRLCGASRVIISPVLMSTTPNQSPALHLRIIGDCPVVLWGLSSAERLHRQIRSTGTVIAAADSALQPKDTVLLLRRDYVYDQRIIRNLIAERGVVLQGPEGEVSRAVAGHVEARFAPFVERLLSSPVPDPIEPMPLQVTTVDAIADPYIAELLKYETALLLPLQAERRAEIEQRLFNGSYKGVTDVITKYVWPKPAFWVTHLCVGAGIRPNHVTSTSVALACITAALFATGWLASGLVVAWLMTFLDTVDGKLARVTVDSSDLGHFMDKILDIVHPPIWYLAWGLGLSASGTPLPFQEFTRLATIVVGGYIVGRLAEVLFRRVVGGFSMFSWRRFDSRFRLVLARRNPCLIILTASLLLGRPDIGLFAVAAWTVVSGAVLVVRVLQAACARITTGPLHAWLRSA